VSGEVGADIGVDVGIDDGDDGDCVCVVCGVRREGDGVRIDRGVGCDGARTGDVGCVGVFEGRLLLVCESCVCEGCCCLFELDSSGGCVIVGVSCVSEDVYVLVWACMFVPMLVCLCAFGKVVHV